MNTSKRVILANRQARLADTTPTKQSPATSEPESQTTPPRAARSSPTCQSVHQCDRAPSPAAKHLRVIGLSHAYALTEILSNIDVEVESGQVTALVGPSGCGKTTLMHLVAGLITLREGRIETSFSNPACVFQQPRLLPWKTTLDNIALGLKAAGISRLERQQRAIALANRVGLLIDDLDKFPHQLSGGMQSRVALARALVLEPDLLLLDEPFSALDIGLKAELYRLLAEHMEHREMGALMITHDLMEAVRLSDTILVMAPEPGRIVQRVRINHPAQQRDESFVYHNTAALLENPTVRQVFGLPTSSSGEKFNSSASTVAIRFDSCTPVTASRRAGLQC